MPDNDPQSAIDRFWSNESDYVEAEHISAYLKTNMQALDAVDLYDDLGPEDAMVIDPDRKEQALKRIFRKRGSIRTLKSRLLIAASIIGVLFFIAKYYHSVSVKQEYPVAVTEQIISNHNQRVMNYTLPDGSLADLEPGAEIRFMPDFDKARTIAVTAGNVFFKVRKDPHSPFVVRVNGIHVTALGTQFWVRNFKEQQVVRVDLEEGKVRLNAADGQFRMDTVYLKPDYSCIIDKRTGKVVVSLSTSKNEQNQTATKKKDIQPPGAENGIVWTDAEIRFYNVPLENVFKKIEHSYQVTIIADSAIRRTYLTGKIFHTDSLDTLIRTICELNDLTYVQRNDTLFIKK